MIWSFTSPFNWYAVNIIFLFSLRLLQSLADFSDSVSLPISSNAQTFTQKFYALRLTNVDTNSFEGETFSVNLGSVEEAQNSSTVIDEEALQVTQGSEENTEATASVQVPMTTFSEITFCNQKYFVTTTKITISLLFE